jgi:hypothetical protein
MKCYINNSMHLWSCIQNVNSLVTDTQEMEIILLPPNKAAQLHNEHK